MPKIAQVSWEKLRKVFEKEGFVFQGQKGSHLVYSKAGISRPVIIPKYRQIPVFVIKNNLKTAKISRERYFRLLRKT